jgi:CRISPR-associated endoribonuclease Cas6
MMPDSYVEQRLYSIVFRLGALRKGAIPPDHGSLVHAALYALLRTGDPLLASEQHDSNAHKLFTVSLIEGGKPDREGAHHFAEGDVAEWRFTLLRDPAFEALVQRYVNDRALPHIRIGAMEFGIQEAFVSGSHPRSGYIAVERLRDRYSTQPAQKHVTLDFLSPTLFSLGTDRHKNRRWRTLPHPRTVFSALRKRWASIGGADPGDNFDSWVEKTIEAVPMALRWQRAAIKHESVRGFIGVVRFEHWGDDESGLPFLNMLADMAFYSGVGYQTTSGLGQVRRIRDRGDTP